MKCQMHIIQDELKEILQGYSVILLFKPYEMKFV